MNRMDGSVMVTAEGPENELLGFLEEIRKAHIYRYVVTEDLGWASATGEFTGFTIKYA
jgi:acylphosphatase